MTTQESYFVVDVVVVVVVVVIVGPKNIALRFWQNWFSNVVVVYVDVVVVVFVVVDVVDPET